MTFPHVLWFSSLSPGSPLHASPWLSLLASPSVPLQSRGHVQVPQPLLILSPGAQLLVSPVLEQRWSRAWKWISWLLALPVRPKHH